MILCLAGCWISIPPKYGNYMYINFTEMQMLIEKLDQTVCTLVRTKEKIEYERKRLASNTEHEDVRAVIKKTADKLDDEILAAKKLRLSLAKISEIYISGEQRINDAVEGEICSVKSGFCPMMNLDNATDFRWEIE